ncbi:MAG: DUF4147 domain-containing protein [Deltaproteobacteria bacterium]|nr:DUF4147 domain-containing protein [Deltaproteobacteria bacterium]
MKTLSATIFSIFESALKKVDPERTLFESLQLKKETLTVKTGDPTRTEKVDLRRFNRIEVLGAGKASVTMAAAC